MIVNNKTYSIDCDRTIGIPREVIDALDSKRFVKLVWSIENGRPFISVFGAYEKISEFWIGGRTYSFHKDDRVTLPENLATIMDPDRNRRFYWELIGRRAFLNLVFDAVTDMEKKKEEG